MLADVVSEGVDPRFACAQRGCQESLNQLLREHEGLVQAAVRRQVTGCGLFSDLLQAGREGLWQAILGYQPQRGTRFATYAWPCIVHAIWHAARAPRRRPAVGLAPSLWGSTDPAQLYLAGQICAELYALIARLPTRLQDVVVQRYGLNGARPATWAHIGSQWGVTKERARQLHQEALLWLQQPAHAQRLRSLLGRHTVAEYAAARARQAHWRARGRRRHG
jgi:RNA polymerase sigma factor (sigma-70 family)